MKILWTSSKPLSSSDILEKKEIETWAEKSFHPLINNLIKKGFVRITGKRQAVKTFCRLYTANISMEDYTTMQVNEVFKTGMNETKFGLGKFLSGFVDDNENKKIELISELQEWIDKERNDKVKQG